MGTYAVRPSGEVATSCPVMPPSGTVASCVAVAGSMMLRSRSPWLVATSIGFTGESGIAEASVISRLTGRTRQSAEKTYTTVVLFMFMAQELYPPGQHFGGEGTISWFSTPMTQTQAKPQLKQASTAQPVWPAVVAVLAVGGLHLALPEPLTFGPSWLLLAVVSVLLVPVLIARMRGSFDLNQKLGYVLLGVVTAAMLWSLALLVWSLPRHTLPPSMLLRSAAALWVT